MTFCASALHACLTNNGSPGPAWSREAWMMPRFWMNLSWMMLLLMKPFGNAYFCRNLLLMKTWTLYFCRDFLPSLAKTAWFLKLLCLYRFYCNHDFLYSLFHLFL